MKRFIGFVKKEFFHIFRDKRTMVILFGIPIAQILIFGYVITNEIKNAKIAILDKSKDEITKKITSKILSSDYFQLYKNLSSTKDIEKVFKKGEVKEVIIFEPDFAQKLEKQNNAKIQVIVDASDPNTANILVNFTKGIINRFVKNENSQIKYPLQIVPEVRMVFNERLKGVYMFVPGTMALILMLISAMMTSISLAREKEIGTMEILLASPLKPIQIILGKVTPYLVLSFINAVIIIMLGNFVFGVPVKGSLLLLLTESILFIFLALSIGIFISTKSNNQQIAMMISMFGLMLPTILLSGFIFPIQNMPTALQIISLFMPPRWFIIIIKDIMIKGTGFLYVWKETLILCVMIVAFIGLSVKNFKVRLE